MGSTTQKLHGNNKIAKGRNAHGGVQIKTMFDTEAEPLNLSIATGAGGVELHKDGVPVVPPDGFPEHYADEAARLRKRVREAWRGANMPRDFTGEFVLARGYEAIGGVGYHVQFIQTFDLAIANRLTAFFSEPDRWGRDPHEAYALLGLGPQKASAPDWHILAGLRPEGVNMFRRTAKRAAEAAEAKGETSAAMREFLMWLVFLDELVTNPYRIEDAVIFARYCVRKIEERAGGASA